MTTEDKQSVSFPAIKIRQPIGEFFIASINYKDICDITFFDVRRILEEREVETYLGIQRPLNKKRVKEIAKYTNTVDASFPTAVIVAVNAECAEYDEGSKTMTLSNYIDPSNEDRNIFYRQIARVLDGQHRLEGLNDGYHGETFEINVAVFVSIDIAEQANIFSTVNLAQTKVNKSLAYDLFSLAKSRSPQKTCHNIAVALDQNTHSPFYHRIKRLGTATEGRFSETITQATFVESLLPYFSSEPKVDRDIFKRGKKPGMAQVEELDKYIFRNMFLSDQEIEIADIVLNYFSAVQDRWNAAWCYNGKGLMLNKTNGFKALMRLLRPVYLHLTRPGSVPTKEEFKKIFDRIDLKDEDFTIERFKPGTSGESELYRTFLTMAKVTVD